MTARALSSVASGALGSVMAEAGRPAASTWPIGPPAKSYLLAIGLFLAAVPISIAIRMWIGPVPSLPFVVAIVLVARMGRMGPTVLVALLSAVVLEGLFLSPKYGVNPLELALTSVAMLTVAVIVKRTVDSLRSAEGKRAQLEGVQLAARELADRLGNSLALASATIELLDEVPDLSTGHRRLLTNCRARLRDAGEDLRKLQRISHVEVRETSLGPMLDLDRSANWSGPTPAQRPLRARDKIREREPTGREF